MTKNKSARQMQAEIAEIDPVASFRGISIFARKAVKPGQVLAINTKNFAIKKGGKKMTKPNAGGDIVETFGKCLKDNHKCDYYRLESGRCKTKNFCTYRKDDKPSAPPAKPTIGR